MEQVTLSWPINDLDIHGYFKETDHWQIVFKMLTDNHGIVLLFKPDEEVVTIIKEIFSLTHRSIPELKVRLLGVHILLNGSVRELTLSRLIRLNCYGNSAFL